MVNLRNCAMLAVFARHQSIRPGRDLRDHDTGAILDRFVARVRALPIKLS